MKNCIFASKDNHWSNSLFSKLDSSPKANWVRVQNKTELKDALRDEQFDWVFFFHWSNIVPNSIYDNNRCVVVHTSNLPEGRGGSPLQNQIVDGIISSRVNALRMVGDVDAGPVYDSRPITFQGSLFDIWMTIADISHSIISDMVDNEKNNMPVEQKISDFEKSYKRRKGSLVDLYDLEGLSDVYDRIRMLDAEGYPVPQLSVGNFTIELSRAKFDGERLICDATITKGEHDE